MTESVYEGIDKYYIMVNDYGRAALRKAPTATEAVERYEKEHGDQVKVVQVIEQPNATGSHVQVWKVDRSLRLVRMDS